MLRFGDAVHTGNVAAAAAISNPPFDAVDGLGNLDGVNGYVEKAERGKRGMAINSWRGMHSGRLCLRCVRKIRTGLRGDCLRPASSESAVLLMSESIGASGANEDLVQLNFAAGSFIGKYGCERIQFESFRFHEIEHETKGLLPLIKGQK